MYQIIILTTTRQQSYNADNWNRIIGVVFGLKVWQLLAFLVIPCLFVAIQCKNRRNVSDQYFKLECMHDILYVHVFVYIIVAIMCC